MAERICQLRYNRHCKIRINGRTVVASRVFCRMVYGPPPTDKHEAAHSCGRGEFGCINPRHIRWLTPTQNQAERILHGTANRGMRHGLAKLTDEQVLNIYHRAVSGREPQTLIAAAFGISQTAISEIKLGKCWGWLTGASS